MDEHIIKQVILGIDPGTNILGYSVIEISGKNIKLMEINVLHMDKGLDHYAKLKRIFGHIKVIIHEFKPTAMAIESPFFGKNVQSMLKLGRAQGVAITVACPKVYRCLNILQEKSNNLSLNGNASKEQVAAILSQLLEFDHKYLLLDATDALGVAVCHHFQNKMLPKNLIKAGGGNNLSLYILIASDQ